jgi:type IV secretory pathway VirB2 component (pilin)
MAEERIEFKIIVDDTGALVGLKSTQKGVKDIDLTARGAQESARRLTQEIERLGNGKTVTAIKLTGNELKNLNKTLEQQKNATGASTSAVLELGRVIQDAPYGIRGMANNITQLVTQVSFATVAAGGFTAALKQMWKALMGPLGIVLAISAVVAILDGMYGGQKKVKEATDETTESLKKQITPLEKLISKGVF